MICSFNQIQEFSMKGRKRTKKWRKSPITRQQMRADSFASRKKSAHMAVNNDPLLPKKRAEQAGSVVAFCSWGPPSRLPLWAVLTCQKSKTLYMKREMLLWLTLFLVQSQGGMASALCSPLEGNWGKTPSEHDGFNFSSWPWVELYAPTDTVL